MHVQFGNRIRAISHIYTHTHTLTMRLLHELYHHPVRGVKTLCLIMLCCYTGINLAIVGPTLVNLQARTNSTVTEASYGLSARSAAAAVGSLLGRSLLLLLIHAYDLHVSYHDLSYTVFLFSSRVNCLLTLSIVSVISCIGSLAIAFLSSQVGQWIAFAVMGVCLGIQSAYTNILLFTLWGKEVSAFQQLSFAVLGAGTMIAPVIVGHFVSVHDADGGDDLSGLVWTVCH